MERIRCPRQNERAGAVLRANRCIGMLSRSLGEDCQNIPLTRQAESDVADFLESCNWACGCGRASGRRSFGCSIFYNNNVVTTCALDRSDAVVYDKSDDGLIGVPNDQDNRTKKKKHARQTLTGRTPPPLPPAAYHARNLCRCPFPLGLRCGSGEIVLDEEANRTGLQTGVEEKQEALSVTEQVNENIFWHFCKL